MDARLPTEITAMVNETTDNAAPPPSSPPPSAEVMERAVLGIMLLSPSTVPEVEAALSADSFVTPTHRTIFRAILALHQGGGMVDLVTVTQRLRDQGELEGIGGVGYLTGLLEDQFLSSHLGTYLRELKEKAILRRSVADIRKADQKIREDPGQLRQALDEVRDKAEEHGRALDLAGKHIPPMREVLLDVEIVMFEKLGKPIPTFSEGMNRNLNGGFHAGKVCTIAGAAGGGKTTLIYQAAEEIAQANYGKEAGAILNIPVYVCMEQSQAEMLVKSYSRLAGINGSEFETGEISPDSPEIVEARKLYSKEIAPYMYIVEAGEGMMVSEVREIVRKIDSQITDPHQILLVVDPFQRLRTGDANLDKDEISRVGAVAGRMKLLARDLQIPVILLSDTTKEQVKSFAKGESNSGTAIRGSYMPEHTTDVSAVILTGGPEKLREWGERAKKAGYRTRKYDEMSERCDTYIRDNGAIYPCYACLDFSKQRSGPTSSVLFLYKKALNTFVPLEAVVLLK